jgi:hypothetical protein
VISAAYAAVRSEVERLVAECARACIEDDDEGAHAREDEMRELVLGHIASGNLTAEQAQDLARLSLQTEQYEFARWCA